MGETPDQLTHDIEGTRADLTRDVDALADKVSPHRVVERRVERSKQGLSRVKDTVMGSAHDAADSAGSVTDTAGDKASMVAGKARQGAQGNPLAAGLIAFGAGWLVSSLIPVTQKEARAATTAVDAAKEHAGPARRSCRRSARRWGRTSRGRLPRRPTS